MSWWVKEIESITEDNLYRLCYIEADDTTLFPAPVQQKEISDPDNPGQTIWTTDYTIVRGSKLYCLSNASWYKLNSSGQWIKQTPEGGGGGASSADQVSYDNTDSGLTATNVQDAIDEIKDTDDMQDRALAELSGMDANQQLEIDYAINTGAKNLLKVTASSGVLNTATIDIADDGSIHISGQPTDNGAYVISSGINLVISDNAYILSGGAEAGNTKMSISLRRAGTSQYVDLYRAESRIIPSGTYDRAHIYLYSDTNYDTTVYPMIRRAEITDSTYVPYAPTNRELYETARPAYDFIFGLGTALASNDDLNNYNKVGKIYAATGAIAETISNTPWTASGFMVITIPYVTSSTFIQFLLPNTSGGKWYKRRYTTGAWGVWTEYDGTQVASVQSVSPSLMLNREEITPLETDVIKETEETASLETNEIEETE